MTFRRVLLVVGIGVPAALFALPLFGAPEREAAADFVTDEGTRSSLRQLEDLLAETRRAWNPRVKARTVKKARGRLQVIKPPLLWVLTRPSHDLLAEAIYVASELGLKEAHARLVGLTGTAAQELRPVALRAAGKLSPWSKEQLLEFFMTSDAGVRVAALEAAALAPVELLPAIMGLLADSEPSVREAALAAMPTQMPANAREELMGLARFAEQEHEVMCLRALGKLRIDQELEAFLVDKLRTGKPTTRAAALDVLAGKQGKLQEPRWVWDVATIMANDALERARALRCIERTRSFTAEDVIGQLSFFEDPLSRFFAARCLIRSGEKQGAEILLDLVESGVGPVAGLDDPEMLLLAARKLLGRLAGSTVEANPEGWRAWLFGVARLPARELDESDLVF